MGFELMVLLYCKAVNNTGAIHRDHLWLIYIAAPKMEATVLYNLISELIYHCFCNAKMIKQILV